jgi:flagellar basal body-associated protein FliL
MITNLLLLDVLPEPIPNPLGIVGLMLIVVIVLMLITAAITGFVFLLRWLMRRGPQISCAVDETASQPITQFQASSPNQP